MSDMEATAAAGEVDPPRFDILTTVPSELTNSILRYLSPVDLLTSAQVSKEWRELSENELLWKEICLRKWEGKYGFENVTHPFWRIDFSKVPSSTLSQLSARDLRNILNRRYVNHSHCIEKQEFVSLLLSTTPPRDEFTFGPKEGLRTMWKQSYFSAELDSKRRAISTKELSDLKWNFRFRWQRDAQDFRWQYPGGDLSNRVIIFHMDYSISGFPEEMQTFSWRFHGNDPSIRIDDYPPLKLDRLDDWSWCMYNEYVVFWVGSSDKFPEKYYRPYSYYNHGEQADYQA